MHAMHAMHAPHALLALLALLSDLRELHAVELALRADPASTTLRDRRDYLRDVVAHLAR